MGDIAKARQDLAKANQDDGKTMLIDFFQFQHPFWTDLSADFMTAVQEGNADRARAGVESILAKLRQSPEWMTSQGNLLNSAQILMPDVQGPLFLVLKQLDARAQVR